MVLGHFSFSEKASAAKYRELLNVIVHILFEFYDLHVFLFIHLHIRIFTYVHIYTFMNRPTFLHLYIQTL